ncbi:MAG: aminoglycoside phosphotransferase family protein [Deinococcota bacterium]
MFEDVLAHLVSQEFLQQGHTSDWHYQRVSGGANNLLYKAVRGHQQVAIKFTPRDERQRAAREYYALQAIQQAGYALAPQALYLNTTAFVYPATVQTWLEGEVKQQPPVTDRDWERLLEHFITIHSITPDTLRSQHQTNLQPAVLTAFSMDDAINLINIQLAKFPASQELINTAVRVSQLNISKLHQHPCLCRTDSNILNFIWQADKLYSVDWENSGWGNPLFELAELTTHPSYLDVDDMRWHHLIETYVHNMDIPELAKTVFVYRHVMLVWWLARLARYIYELPRGRDARLAQAAFMRLEDMQYKYDIYQNRVAKSEETLL